MSPAPDMIAAAVDLAARLSAVVRFALTAAQAANVRYEFYHIVLDHLQRPAEQPEETEGAT